MRSMVYLLFATAFWPGLVAGADIEIMPVVEIAAPGGGVSVEQLEAYPDGGAALSVTSDIGDLAVIRLDPEGRETSRWTGPLRIGSHSDISGPALALDVRDDGSAGVLVPGSSPWTYAVLGPDSTLLSRHPVGVPIDREPVLVRPDGFTVPEYGPGHPYRMGLADYHVTGVRRAVYFPEGTYLRDARPRAVGGIVVREVVISGLPARFVVRALDPGLGVLWTQDFAGATGGMPAIEGTIDGPGGTVLAYGRQGPPNERTPVFFALLDANGQLLWQAVTPPRAPYITIDAYRHDAGFGFVSIMGNWPDACLLQGTITAAGDLSSQCDPAPSGTTLHRVRSRATDGGVQVLVQTSTSTGNYGQLLSKAGTQPAQLRELRWNGALQGEMRHGAFAADEVLALLVANGRNRLLRFGQGELPESDRDLSGRDEYHLKRARLVDSSGDLLFALSAESHVDVLRSPAAGGIEWQVQLPGNATGVDVSEAADGSYRVLAQGAHPTVFALSREGALLWSHRVSAPVGLSSRVVAVPDGNTLVGYGVAGESCRARRLDADGNVTGDVALTATGEVTDAAPLDDGAVFTCAGLQTEVQVRVDGALAAVPADTAACAVVDSKIAALGGSQWLLTGISPDARNVVHLCVFKNTTLAQAASVGFESNAYPRWLREWMYVDARAGKVQIGVASHSFVRPDSVSLVSYDVAENVARRHVIRDIEDYYFSGFSGPDSRGRVAFAYRPHEQGAPAFIEFGMPGQAPSWQANLPAEITGDLELSMARDHLRFSTAESESLNQVVYRLGRARADVVFEDAFEGPVD